MRLRDYKFYPATFEPCEVQGSKNGFKAVVHTIAMDIVTYGINYDNTVKMAQSVITDMAHAMSYEDNIPQALTGVEVLDPASNYNASNRKEIHSKNDVDQELDVRLRSLVQLMKEDSKSQDLAEPTYVKSLAPEQNVINRKYKFNVDIELPTQTAIKIVIANYLASQHKNLNSLASNIGCKKEELERQLDFYQDTSIYDLKLIISCLDLKISDLDELGCHW